MNNSKAGRGRGSFWLSTDSELCIHKYSYTPGSLCCLPHIHPEYNVAFCVGPQIEFSVSGEDHALNPGDVLVINPGEVHYGLYDSVPETSGLTIHIGVPALRALLRRMGLRMDLDHADVILQRRVHDKAVLPFIQELVCELEERKSGYDLVVESLVVQIMVHLLRHSLEPKPCHLPLSPVRHLPSWQMILAFEYMNTRGKSLFNLPELCSELGTSSTRLIQLFKNSVGDFSPQTFYNRIIVLKAQQQLRQTDSPVKQIAFDLGFQNESHFCKLFRTLAGTTPGKYRSLAAENQLS